MTKRSGARTGGRILVDQLRINGCDRNFTVPGESFPILFIGDVVRSGRDERSHPDDELVLSP